jgi:hypothetical protein
MFLRSVLAGGQRSNDGFGGELVTEAGLVSDFSGHEFPFIGGC